MNKKLLYSGLLFGFLFALSLGGLLDKEQGSGDAKEKEVPLLGFDERDVVRVRVLGSLTNSLDISRAKTLSVESPLLHRSNWVLKDPVFAPVNEEVFTDLIERVRETSGSVLNEFVDEASLGLVPPELIVMLDFENGKNEVLSFGSKSPVTGKRFIQKEGDSKVYSTSKDLPKFFSEISEKIKSKEVLKINPDLVLGVDAISGDEYFRLKSDKCESKQGANRPLWTVDMGTVMQGDDDFISRKILELSRLKVKRIFETPVDIFSFTGLDAPFLVLNVAFQVAEDGSFVCDATKKKELLLQFGKGLGVQMSDQGSLATDASYYLKIGGEVRLYEIEKGFFSDWLQGGYHFRNRQPLKEIDSVWDNLSSITMTDPSISCSVVLGDSSLSKEVEKDGTTDMSPLKNKAISFEEAKATLRAALVSVKFDALLQEYELDQYPKINGSSITLAAGDEQIVVEIVGQVVPEIELGASPLIVSIKNTKEEVQYGVLQSDVLADAQKFIDEVCRAGAQK